MVVICMIVAFFLIGNPPPADEITWGVNFSQKHAENFGFNWQEVYLAFLDDLGVNDIRVATYWDLIEDQNGEFVWDDLDWIVEQTEEREVNLILAVGMKTLRWPECHLPEWAQGLGREEQQREILELIRELVMRYRNSSALKYWQVENEPFFPYGSCPWVDRSFLQREIDLVRTLDSEHRVLITDSGEGSFWISAAKMGDLVGTTMYKKVWFRQARMYFSYPFPPVFYWRKAWLVERLFGDEVICVELQAEPWGPLLIYDLSMEEQKKTMNIEQFHRIVNFARSVGFKENYFWGAEWWYWLRENRNDSQIWDSAKLLF